MTTKLDPLQIGARMPESDGIWYESPDDVQAQIAGWADRERRRRWLYQYVHLLPKAQRYFVWLRLQGYGYDEIARMAGVCNRAVVFNAEKRAIRNLRKRRLREAVGG